MSQVYCTLSKRKEISSKLVLISNNYMDVLLPLLSLSEYLICLF